MADTSHADAGCIDPSAGMKPALILPGTSAAAVPSPSGMTACLAAPLIQKEIA